MQRRPFHSRKAAIDAAHHLLNLVEQARVNLHFLCRWHADGDQRDLAVQLWPRLQKLLISQQLFKDALGVIQALHRQNHLDIAKLLFELANLRLHAFLI